MARKRISDVAKELGVESKAIIGALEGLGIANRKPQNAIEDSEVKDVRLALGIDVKPEVSVGNEVVREGLEGETIQETRVKSNVIRRRTKRREAEGLGDAVTEPLAVPGDSLPPAPLPSGLPLPPPLPEVPPVPVVPVVEASGIAAATPLPPQVVGVPASEISEAVVPPKPVPPAAAPPAVFSESELMPQAPAQPPPLKVPPRLRDEAPRMATVTADGSAAVRGPKVLGRIDLSKATAPAPAAARAARGRRDASAPGAAQPAAMPPMPPASDADAKRKKRKRRVIKNTGAMDPREEQSRVRVPRKRRALPGKEQRKTAITTPAEHKRVVRISEVVTVGELAKAIGVKAAEILKKLMDSGMMATINQLLDADTASLLASDFGYNVENVAFDADSALEVEHEPTEDESSSTRPPVVTIMGHVDHGKTSLLDAIRSTSVTSQEAGGITQHIGAYSVDVDGRTVTFLDTPGHEAFTAMRSRGAKVTDIVVLIVAADDGVMPQTVEAINHARAAAVPIIVAINKIDKPGADLERVRQQLADNGLVAEEWGGDTVCAPVSAHTREGIPELLELLLLQADILDLRCNPDKLARGTIVEAKLDRGRGPVATVLVQEGTLKRGDPFVCGGFYGRVRAMVGDRGERVDEAPPSMPVEILGLQGVPEAGTSFVAVADEATARQVAEHRRTKQREAEMLKSSKVSLEDLYKQVNAGDVKDLKLVVKADVQGSVEALTEALQRLSTPEVRVSVIHASVGGITESDALLASASNAIVIGFNVRPEAKANAVLEREGVDTRTYSIIYDALNEVRAAMEGMLDPTYREKTVGRAEIRETFSVPDVGIIAGSYVLEGKITRNATARLVRDSVVVHNGKIGSLRRFKDDAREVLAGYECGIGLDGYNDIKVGDVIEVYEQEAVERRLSAPTAAGRHAAA